VFEHFTQGARRVLVVAQDEARQLSSSSLKPAHLLLALLREEDGIAATALADAGVDYEHTRGLIAADSRRGAADPGAHALSGSSMRVIERSVQISWAQADGGVDTRDLLLALLELDDETIEAVLASLDVTPEEVLQRIDVGAR
jgi:ATP-dependent Clp protease ATP-binding subunit ClpC